MLGIPLMWLGAALLALAGGVLLSLAGLQDAAASLYNAALPMFIAGGFSLLTGLALCEWRRRQPPSGLSSPRQRGAGVGDKGP